MKNIAREKIIITSHVRIRVRSRLFTNEELKDLIVDRNPIKVEKSEDREFELKYINPIKGNDDIIVIVVVHDPHRKIYKSSNNIILNKW
ncbi:MAG: hypothetical protein PQ975_00500 [Methanobacterium sp.]